MAGGAWGGSRFPTKQPGRVRHTTGPVRSILAARWASAFHVVVAIKVSACLARVRAAAMRLRFSFGESGLDGARLPVKARVVETNNAETTGSVHGSILVLHHHGDRGLRVVDVERAARRDQLDQTSGAVVVADVERNGDARGSGTAPTDGK